MLRDEEVRKIAEQRDESGEPLWKRRDFVCPDDFIGAVRFAADLLHAFGTTEAMIEAWYHELEQWGLRRNKSEDLVYEVYRHSSPDVVSPVVIESFGIHDDAERRRVQLETQAAYRAMLAALKETSDNGKA